MILLDVIGRQIWPSFHPACLEDVNRGCSVVRSRYISAVFW